MNHRPAFWDIPHHPASALLSPGAWVWQAVTRFKRTHSIPKRTPIPSLCVGNITVGGAGKTPVALAIAALLQEKGENVAFGTRGYGAALPSAVTQVDLVQHTAAMVGDEAMLLAAQAQCFVGHDRHTLAGAAAATGAQRIIYDDGLQNPYIAYDMAVLVLDGAYGLGNGRIIPSGPLRETLEDALPRCQAVVLIGDDTHHLSSRLGNTPLLRATIKPDETGLDRQKNYFAFAGIARPEKFFATCRSLGLQLSGTRAFPDHYAFKPVDLVALDQAAREQQATLITTAKDAVRLSPVWRSRVAVLPITLEFDDPAAVISLLASYY